MTSLAEREVIVKTRDGMADCYFVHPLSGAHPGVVLWPDAVGLRPAYRSLGKRLAQSGYSVLVVNPYYRVTPAPIDVNVEGFATPVGRQKVLSLVDSVTPEMTATDALDIAEFLYEQPSVDSKRKLGTLGYCLGAPMAVRTAVELAHRVGAVVAFHGARLVTQDPSSPHLRLVEIRAAMLIAIAESDDATTPAAKFVLRQACDEANLSAEIEVYPGTAHGWCVPDARAYDPPQADHAWSRLLLLLSSSC